MLTRRQRLTKGLKRLHLLWSGRRGQASPVFVFGEMRSGTNMLARALERHEHVECFHENDEEAFDGYVLRPSDTIARLVRQSRARRVVFKSIAEMGRAKDLMQAFPGAKALFIFRQYEDVVNSALRNFSFHREYLRVVLEDEQRAGWRRWGFDQEHLEAVRRFYDAGVSDASARALIWYVRNDTFIKQGLFETGAVAILNYESLVQDPHAHFRFAARFVGLDFSPRMSRGVVASSIRRSDAPELDPEIKERCERLFADLTTLTEQRGLERTSS